MSFSSWRPTFYVRHEYGMRDFRREPAVLTAPCGPGVPARKVKRLLATAHGKRKRWPFSNRIDLKLIEVCILLGWEPDHWHGARSEGGGGPA